MTSRGFGHQRSMRPFLQVTQDTESNKFKTNGQGKFDNVLLAATTGRNNYLLGDAGNGHHLLVQITKSPTPRDEDEGFLVNNSRRISRCNFCFHLGEVGVAKP